MLAGPSGAGKSRLAARLSARHGWPTVRLDDFYRDGDDPALPMLPIGIPDWDHPDSWHTEAAVSALERLSPPAGSTCPPTTSALPRPGRTTVTADARDVVLAEGIFAAEIVPHLQPRGLLARAYCIRQNRWLTFWRRFVRDLAERRKPRWCSGERGLRLCRAEPAIVRHHASLGALPRIPASGRARARGHAVPTMTSSRAHAGPLLARRPGDRVGPPRAPRVPSPSPSCRPRRAAGAGRVRLGPPFRDGDAGAPGLRPVRRRAPQRDVGQQRPRDRPRPPAAG